MRAIIHKVLGLIIPLVVVLTFVCNAQAAVSNSIVGVKAIPLPDDKAQITLEFAQPLNGTPKSFVTKKPPRIIFDFADITNGLKDKSKQSVDVGAAKTLKAIQAGGRTRIILDLSRFVSYKTQVQGNKLYINLASGTKSRATQQMQHQHFAPNHYTRSQHSVMGIDFRATKDDGGKIIVNVSDPNVGVDVQQRGSRMLIDFINTALPTRLQRKLDVTDFRTPVQTIETLKKGRNVELSIKIKGHYDHFAYQVNKQFIIDIKPMTKAQKEKAQMKKTVYTGKRISLNFQDIKVRAVLQLLSDFTGTNIVVSDTVTGNITLRLNNVPWDQALDIILRTRGLDKRHFGSVMLIAPATEIAAREQQELKAQQKVEELAPLQSELLQINYAKASDIAKLLKEQGNSLLSKRGNVSVDSRTNMLWVQDTGEKIEEISHLIHKLDIPVKQVLIEARIVNVEKTFEEDIGVRFGVTSPNHLSGTLEGANDIRSGIDPVDVDPIRRRLNVDLGAIPVDAASIGLAVARIGKGILLDLELSALESEGRGEVISSPRLITANQQTALIEAGEEIPYQEATSSGATAIAFKKAVLSLQVRPQITPDLKIILDLQVNQDIASAQLFNGVPSIKTKEIRTRVLVDNGQTVVLGGIYIQDKKSDIRRVPFLGSLPIIGHLFRNKAIKNNREELLIFVTPKIIQHSFGA